MDKKKEVHVLEEIQKLKETMPSVLKCSRRMAKKIKKRRAGISNPILEAYINKLRIIPSDQIPDHIVLFCDERMNVIRMVNLMHRPSQKPIIIGG